ICSDALGIVVFGASAGRWLPGCELFLSRARSGNLCLPRFSGQHERDPEMPSFEHHGAHIYYEEFGRGFPILTFAPAGLQSVIAVWRQESAPINPTTEWAADYRVIAMDQRNAGGRSRAPITVQDGWDNYTAHHIAFLDHLRIDRCQLYRPIIGGSFILNLIKTQPERVQSAVLAQPIGRLGPMAPGRPARFNSWAETLTDHPEASPQVLDAFCQ